LLIGLPAIAWQMSLVRNAYWQQTSTVGSTLILQI